MLADNITLTQTSGTQTTKSLARLQRMAKRLKVEGLVMFVDQYHNEFRYALRVEHANIPLGSTAQLARAELRRLAGA